MPNKTGSFCDKPLISGQKRGHGNTVSGVPKKMFLTLTLHIETVTTIMLGILGFSVSTNLHNSFDT